jgi:DNA-directed RNA polymerase specialized sigma24 family protein
MGDEFVAWLQSQGTSLRKIHVLIRTMADGELAEVGTDAVIDELFKQFREGRKPTETPSKLSSYIRTIAKRAFWRHRRRFEDLPEYEPLDVALAPDFSDPGLELRQQEVWDVVQSTLTGVTYQNLEVYEVIRLIHLELHPHTEVARMLGVKKVTITRAKQKGLALLEQLKPELRGEV